MSLAASECRDPGLLPDDRLAVRQPAGVRRTSAALFALLVLAYLLVFSGGFHSIDEIALFAQTESAFKWRELHTDQLTWVLWAMQPNDTLVATGLGPHVYSKKPPLGALLALPLYAFAWAWPALDLVHTTVFLNVLLTAATGVLVYRLARLLEAPPRTALAVALVFGLLTPSAVYAKLFFSEPAAAFFLALALLALLPGHLTAARAAIAGLSLGLSAAAAFQAAATFPAFGLYTLWRLRAHESRLRPVLSLAVAWALPLLGIALFNALRYGSPLDTGYELDTGLEAFTSPLWEGVYGILASPLRGALFYAPALLLLIPAWPRFWRRRRPEALLILGASVPYLLLVAQWFKWWAGASWGPRYLVVLMPLLVLPLLYAPLRSKGALALLALSGLAQALGVLVNFNPYEAEMRQVYAPFPTAPLLWNPLTSPLVAHARSIVAGQLDLPWRPTAASLGLLAAVVAALIWVARSLLRGAPAAVPLGRSLARGTRAAVPLSRSLLRGTPAAVPLSLALALSLAQLLLLSRQTRLEAPAGIFQAVQALESDLRPGDEVVAMAGHPASLLFNFYRGTNPWVAFNAEDPARHPFAVELLEERLSGAGRLWLIAPQIPPAQGGNALEAWLVRHAYPGEDAWRGQTRLRSFETSASEWRPADASWRGGVRLKAITVPEGPSRPGDELPIGLLWESPPDDGTKMFVHLVSQPGAPPVVQRDRLPLEGFASGGSPVADRLSLRLPGTLAPGRYELLLGWYDPSTLERLALQNGETAYPLATITITALSAADQ